MQICGKNYLSLFLNLLPHVLFEEVVVSFPQQPFFLPGLNLKAFIIYPLNYVLQPGRWHNVLSSII